jgi:hypothetical protein
MCRTSILKKIGGYRVDRCGEDWDMFLRMGEVTKLANLKDSHYLYRVHSNSTNVLQMKETRIQYAYACYCAKLRREGKPEISYGDFVSNRNYCPLWKRAKEFMDIYALSQYRSALTDILGEHRLRGYARLLWASLSSPWWTSQRISREIRKHCGK